MCTSARFRRGRRTSLRCLPSGVGANPGSSTFATSSAATTSWADRAELAVDRRLVARADVVTVISEPMARYYRQFHPSVHCIENGYDGELLEFARMRIATSSAPTGGPRVVRYMGTITRDRIPENLLRALSRDPQSFVGNLELEFYGDSRLLQAAVDRDFPSVRRLLRFLPPVPYAESLEKTLSADLLLFVETSDRSSLSAQGVLTTKLFEYLAAGRPILAEIDPDSLAAQYMRRASPDHVVSTDPAVLLDGIRRLLAAPAPTVDAAFVASLSREAKTREFDALATALVQAHRSR